MPATIKDVALAAGVSVATVSRAVNGASIVLPETRQRILDAVRVLRFTPSGADDPSYGVTLSSLFARGPRA